MGGCGSPYMYRFCNRKDFPVHKLANLEMDDLGRVSPSVMEMDAGYIVHLNDRLNWMQVRSTFLKGIDLKEIKVKIKTLTKLIEAFSDMIDVNEGSAD